MDAKSSKIRQNKPTQSDNFVGAPTCPLSGIAYTAADAAVSPYAGTGEVQWRVASEPGLQCGGRGGGTTAALLLMTDKEDGSFRHGGCSCSSSRRRAAASIAAVAADLPTLGGDEVCTEVSIRRGGREEILKLLQLPLLSS